MPALNYSHLNARTSTAGRNFTIIFATAAVVVITICLIFSFVVPKYRKKHPRRPPSTLIYTPSSTNISAGIASKDFPSHPALCRDLRKRPSGQLRQYDPRSETPFPSAPPLGDSISLPSITLLSHSATDLHQTSHGLFSPAGDRQPSRRRGTVEASCGNGTEQQTTEDRDYILAVPEPCLLRARSAGKAPPLKRQLAKFPMPRSGSSQTDKLAHPNKLFRELELRDSKTSVGTPSPLPTNDEKVAGHIGQASSVLQGVGEPRRAKEQGKNDKTFDLPPQYEMKHWKLRRLERRGTWSSNADTIRDRFKIQRADTVTKLKTPMAGMSSPHGNKKTLEPSSSNNGTVTSSEYQESTISSHFDSGTPPTSPVDASKLNTLPKLGPDDIVTPTTYLSRGRAIPSSMALPSADRLDPMCTIPEGKPTDAKKASISSKFDR